MTSPAKPEVHNVSEHRQRTSEPQPQATGTEDLCEDQTCLSGDMLAVRRRQTNTNKQTDRHGHRNTSLP